MAQVAITDWMEVYIHDVDDTEKQQVRPRYGNYFHIGGCFVVVSQQGTIGNILEAIAQKLQRQTEEIFFWYAGKAYTHKERHITLQEVDVTPYCNLNCLRTGFSARHPEVFSKQI